jgi:hypothetical protein
MRQTSGCDSDVYSTWTFRIASVTSCRVSQTDHPWAGIFDLGEEPTTGDRPTREEQERALRLGGAARTPAKAAELLGISKETFFRLCRADRVHRGTLEMFRARIDEAESAARPIWRAHMMRLCGLDRSAS